MRQIDELVALRDTLSVARKYSPFLSKARDNRRKHMSLLVLLTITQMQIEDNEKGGSIEKHAK